MEGRMNLSLLNVGLLGIGALLIAAAVKDKTPRQIISENVGAVKAGNKSTKLTDEQLRSPTYDEGMRGAYGDDGIEEQTPIQPMTPVNYKVTST